MNKNIFKFKINVYKLLYFSNVFGGIMRINIYKYFLEYKFIW